MIAYLTRAAAIFLALASTLVVMSLPAAADVLGRWQTFNGPGFTYTFDVQVQSGSPAGMRTLSGEITPTSTLDEDCRRAKSGDRFHAYVCDRLSKDGPFPLAANLASSPEQPVLTGTDRNSGATLQLTREEGTAAPLAKLVLSLERDNGSIEAMTLVARRREVRTSPQALVGNWIGSDGALTLEAKIEPVDEDRLAVTVSAFADGERPVPSGRPLDEWHRIAGSERAFAMNTIVGRNTSQPQSFAGVILTWEGEFVDRVGALTEITPTPTGNLRMIFTGGGLGGVPPVHMTLVAADRPLRSVAPQRSVPDMMNGQWIGHVGPLVIEADIEMNEQGETTATLHAFDDPAKGRFPRNSARAFISFQEIVQKRQPFALTFAGSWDGRAGFVAGRSESVKTRDFGVDADTRIRRTGADELSLSMAHPNDDAFDGQPMRLVRRSTPLRPVPPLDEASAKTVAESPLAGSWIWSSGRDRTGNVILLELAGDELGPISGDIRVWNTDGTCEAFQRTQALCELGRDHGPFKNRLLVAATGDERWPFDVLEGLRAHGKEFPAYSDLRMRLRLAGNGSLLVQMTAADAFGAQADNSYVFEKIGSAGMVVPDPQERDYVAGPDDPARGACEAWAKDDSLLRQKNLPEVNARLDRILANQKIGVSGHPLDVQCKDMLDDMAAAGLDPAKEDGGTDNGGGNDRPQDPAAPGSVAGTWRMVGQPHESLPVMGVWQPAHAFRPILSGFEMSGQNGGYSAVEKDGPFVSTFSALNADIERFRSHLEKPVPETGAASLMEWIGTPEALLAGGGGKMLGWVDEQNAMGNELVLLVAGDKALLFTDGPRLASGMIDFMTLGMAPRNLVVAAFQRVDAGSSQEEGGHGGTTIDPAGPTGAQAWRRASIPYVAGTGDNVPDIVRPVANFSTTPEDLSIEIGDGAMSFRVVGGLDVVMERMSGTGPSITDIARLSVAETGSQSVGEWLGPVSKAFTAPAGDKLPWRDLPEPLSYAAPFFVLAGDGTRALVLEGVWSVDGDPAERLAAGYRSSSVFTLIERIGETNDPTPDPSPRGPEVVNNDPVNIPVPPKPEPNAVCQALAQREAVLLAQAGTGLVQLIRTIHADAGLASGGEKTESRCQKALDALNAVVLAPETGSGSASAPNGDDPSRGGNLHVVDNSVNVFNVFVDGGGDWWAPDAPDPCAALDTVSGMLTISGGLGMSGFLDGLFVDIGFSLTGPRSPELCYDAMLELWDYGVDPALDDGGWGVVRVIHDAGRTPDRPSRDPAESRACRAYNAFTSALLAKGGTPMVQFLRGYAIDRGYGMGSTREPSPADCARMLAELRDLGLDPNLPDGGMSEMSEYLFDDGDESLLVDDEAQGYDARPEAEQQLANWLAGSPYTYAVPMTGELQHMGELADVVAFVTPPEGWLGRNRAGPGDEQACMDRRRLPREEGIRAWAAMREIMRHFVPPGSILSGRDCALVEIATEMAFATLGDPSFLDGEDEFVSVTMDRRLDGVGLGMEDRLLAGRTVSAMLRKPEPTEGHPWRTVVTTPEIVAAVTGIVVPHGGFIVWNHRTGRLAGPFRIRLSGEAR